MREQALRPQEAEAKIREAQKIQRVFMCASTHNWFMQQRSHKEGVGRRTGRMERGCQIRRLSHVEPPQCIHEHITKKGWQI
jgi:maltose/maltodextrin transport system substrate-binding protein